jgi:hypothetical protein
MFTPNSSWFWAAAIGMYRPVGIRPQIQRKWSAAEENGDKKNVNGKKNIFKNLFFDRSKKIELFLLVSIVKFLGSLC